MVTKMRCCIAFEAPNSIVPKSHIAYFTFSTKPADLKYLWHKYFDHQSKRKLVKRDFGLSFG